MSNRENVSPGTFCYTSFFGRERPCEDCRLARILRDKTPVTLQMKRDNQVLQVHALPIYNREHEVDGIMEFYRDVTLEMTYEQQLQQADKLASLGQLVSGIGHEINNPNQFIRGNIKILKQSLEDLMPIVDEYCASHGDLKIAKLNYDFWRKNIMMLVDDMDHGSQRIKGIVEGLRTFARKDEGLLVDTIDINTLIEASTRLVHNEVHKQGRYPARPRRGASRLHGQRAEDRAGPRQPDRERRAGDARRRARAHHGADARRGHRRRLRDRGQRHRHDRQDAEADIRPLLHDETRQGRDGTRARDRLSHHRGARREHHGEEQAGRRHDVHRQDPGEIPRAAEERSAAGQTGRPGPAERIAMKRILIVDDDVAVTNYFMVFLVQTGLFEPSVVNDSREVAGLLERERFDAILLDMDMPNVSGMDILRAMRGKGDDTPVVILTGVSDVDLAVRAMKLGAFDYLTKPVDDQNLVQVIEAAIENRTLHRRSTSSRSSSRERTSPSRPPSRGSRRRTTG